MKIGRNDPCWCGSGRKYKACHQAFDEKIEAASIEHAELAEDEIEVGEDEFFVLGDNRNNSEDSRYANIGNVKKEYIVGKAWFIVSPLKDFGFVK